MLIQSAIDDETTELEVFNSPSNPNRDVPVPMPARLSSRDVPDPYQSQEVISVLELLEEGAWIACPVSGGVSVVVCCEGLAAQRPAAASLLPFLTPESTSGVPRGEPRALAAFGGGNSMREISGQTLYKSESPRVSAVSVRREASDEE